MIKRYISKLLTIGGMIAISINSYAGSQTFTDSFPSGGSNQHYLTVPSSTTITTSINTSGAPANGTTQIVIQPYGTYRTYIVPANSTGSQTWTGNPPGVQYIVIHAGYGSFSTTVTW